MKVQCRLDHSSLHPHMEFHISAALPPLTQPVHKVKYLVAHMKKTVIYIVVQQSHISLMNLQSDRKN